MLLDAPCTALGLRPKLQQPLSLPDLLDAAVYQRQLLAAAVQLVQPGGFLVYSTCSISPGESWRRQGGWKAGGKGGCWLWWRNAVVTCHSAGAAS